jgi:predicted Fe-S protein YdhL (DUF1289 family)
MSPVMEGRLGSPCVGICQVDPVSGWCGGCGRSEAEMAAWGDWPEPRRQEVWASLPQRMVNLGSGFRLLPWTGLPLLQRLVGLAGRYGTGWQMGVWGAALQLPAPEARLATDADGMILLRSAAGRMAIRPLSAIRAFEVTGSAAEPARVVLALHRVRFKSVLPSSFVRLGPDHEAIELADRTSELFDLGLGRRPMRFCLRTGDPEIRKILVGHEGADSIAMLPLMQEIAGHSDQIVITPLGRIEMCRSAGTLPSAAGCAELEGDKLRTGREMPPGVHLPPDYVGCIQLRLDGSFQHHLEKPPA